MTNPLTRNDPIGVVEGNQTVYIPMQCLIVLVVKKKYISNTVYSTQTVFHPISSKGEFYTYGRLEIVHIHNN